MRSGWYPVLPVMSHKPCGEAKRTVFTSGGSLTQQCVQTSLPRRTLLLLIHGAFEDGGERTRRAELRSKQVSYFLRENSPDAK